MPSWTQRPDKQSLQGMGLHRGPWEPEEVPEPQLGEEAWRALWRRRHLSQAQGQSRQR